MPESKQRFTCAICHGTFDKAWTDEEARNEHAAMRSQYDKPGVDVDDCGVACEDCFREMAVYYGWQVPDAG